MIEKPLIVGSSPALRSVLRDAKHLAATDMAVLITGETGTGKELLAKQIHLWWTGRDAETGETAGAGTSAKPFLAFNCAAVPDNLIESELFGYEPGAFSGAARRHLGLFKQADGGTLFLDEVGDLSLATQAKLLRALQEGEIRPLGSERVVRVRVRVVAATHKDLASEVVATRFREDLFYRLNASVPLRLPPLRERRTDIPALVDLALDGLAKRTKKQRKHLPHDVLALLTRHSWPGNVRQLLHAVETASAFSPSQTISHAAVARVLGMADGGPRETVDLTAAAVAELAERSIPSAARLRDVTGCSKKEWHAVLRELELQGKIVRRGRGRSTSYVPAGERMPPKPTPPAPTVSPPMPAVSANLNARQAELVATLLVGDRVTTGEYCRRFGVGRATAFRDLDALADANMLVAVGSGCAAAYVRRSVG